MTMQDFATYMRKGHEVAECIVSDYIQAIDGMTPFFVSYEKLPQLVHTMCEHGVNLKYVRVINAEQTIILVASICRG